MPEKILIVDDDLDTLKLVGLMLQRQGYEITAANTGTKALEKAFGENPDLILLDVMMPDMDGYEVTRELRANPDMAGVPIIMFTAKSMVDDKVAGFEAGVDDYMTKPTHPAELVSRVKALLARAEKGRTTPAAPSKSGRVIGVIGAKGGLGTTSLVLNLGVSMAKRSEAFQVIIGDIRPGQGTLGMLSELAPDTGLSNLLNLPVSQVTARKIDTELVQHASGMRVLLSSTDPLENNLLFTATAQAEALVRALNTMADLTLLDLGTGLNPATQAIVPRCSEIVLVLEPVRTSLAMATKLVAALEQLGVLHSHLMVVMSNRSRSSLQLSRREVEETLGLPILGMVTPNPELAYQAADRGAPMVAIQPDSLTADQFRKMAEALLPERRNP